MTFLLTSIQSSVYGRGKLPSIRKSQTGGVIVSSIVRATPRLSCCIYSTLILKFQVVQDCSSQHNARLFDLCCSGIWIRRFCARSVTDKYSLFRSSLDGWCCKKEGTVLRISPPPHLLYTASNSPLGSNPLLHRCCRRAFSTRNLVTHAFY